MTLAEIGIDQLIVDEAQEFRKLTFATNMTSLKGVDPDGSQRAWDLFVKARCLAERQPARPLILASGTPITNTLGELYSLQRFLQPELLRGTRRARVRRLGRQLRRHPHRARAAALRPLQAGHPVLPSSSTCPS